MGSVESLFIAEEEVLQNAIGQNVYFGEILGKHSEIAGSLEASDIKVLSDDQEFILKFIEIIGDGTISGHNPLDYIEYICEECETEWETQEEVDACCQEAKDND